MADRSPKSSRSTETSPPATDASLLDARVESTYRTVGDVELHVVTGGDPADPLVVLLHGFPEFWYSWRNQIERFLEAGYRVLIPDQRGYNLSTAPAGLDAYSLPVLSDDVAALIADEGRSSAHVVGHDWGGTVAWALALRRPDVVDRLCIANVPHPATMRNALLTSPRQVVRSLYALWFQLPRLPEWLLAADDFRRLVDVLERTSAPGTFDERDLRAYRAAWSHGDTVTAMLNWYRAYLRRSDRLPVHTVSQPTRILWGVQDVALLPSLAERSLEHCERGDLRRFEDATHWVHHERPHRFGDAVLDHLGG